MTPFFASLLSLLTVQQGLPSIDDLDPYAEAKRVLEESYSYDAKMVVRRAFWDEESTLMSISVRKGVGSLTSIIHPTQYQGQAMIDDGKKLFHYVPDERRVYVRSSPATFMMGIHERIRLLKQNYCAELASPGKRLDRPVMSIVFEPENDGMPERVMVVDRKLPVIHLYQTRGSDRLTILETVSLQETPPSREKFDFESMTTAAQVNLWGPKDVKDIKIATALLGFQPSQPRTLPYGFKGYRNQLVGKETEPVFATRISDGLCSATVYQWPYASGGRAKFAEMSPFYVSDDVAILAVGDAPPSVLKRLARAYAR